MEYSWELVLDHVNKVLEICEGENWPEVADKLSPYFHWEYEDYQQRLRQVETLLARRCRPYYNLPRPSTATVSPAK
jgi:hypothetical protein